MQFSGKPKFTNPYKWFVVFIGTLVSYWAVLLMPTSRIDLGFLLLSALTVVISSRLSVKIPRVNTNVTVSDTFVFLAIFLYGGPPAVLLAAGEGLCSGFRAGKKPLTFLFNSAVMACSTFATVSVLEFGFGDVTQFAHDRTILLTLSAMALVQYLANTSIVSIGLALKSNQPLWQTWHKHYLWTSITYFAGAAAAGLVLYFLDNWGFYALVAAVPVIAIVYFTYYKYLEDLRLTSADAENAEHARAEAERKRAEQAELHVAELSRHIAEQDRISRALEETKEHFRHAAFHDALTDLPNRALLTEHIKLAIERPRGRDEFLFAVLFLDLDRFKNINDSLGHIAGDQLLIATARALETCLRPMDTVARLGGDEFAILLDGLENQSHAIAVAERIQQALTRPFNLIGHEVYITASIGITLSNGNYTDPENVLRDADTAMYRAKEGGKARFEVFDGTMHSHAVALLKLENDLRRAIERNEFQVYYQPIICLETDELFGFEALVRWNHPERGLVSPDTFIPVAEETGLIVDIGQQVLHESCRQMREWHVSSPGKPLTICVNLSAKQFAQPDLIGRVKQTLEDTGLAAEYVKLEITESVVMKNAEIATAMLMQLCALGVHLSIDDFGTGYSSLSYLHRFPVKTLKIDRSFIGRMGQGGENTEIVRTINTLAQNLGMEVVAEGVETVEQLEQLKSMSCTLGQGYLFSRPLDANAANAYIQDHPTFVPSSLIGDGLIQSQLDLLN
ncbi:MAG: bifunctional diguanylate cyclase/phosphodiesterase [Pyrinomonadaceae bacterium]|nr:bifunctional diguanylate cyclase/phosphodiesterase [Pyrinomonadaceae bacterium]